MCCAVLCCDVLWCAELFVCVHVLEIEAPTGHQPDHRGITNVALDPKAGLSIGYERLCCALADLTLAGVEPAICDSEDQRLIN